MDLTAIDDPVAASDSFDLHSFVVEDEPDNDSKAQDEQTDGTAAEQKLIEAWKAQEREACEAYAKVMYPVHLRKKGKCAVSAGPWQQCEYAVRHPDAVLCSHHLGVWQGGFVERVLEANGIK